MCLRAFSTHYFVCILLFWLTSGRSAIEGFVSPSGSFRQKWPSSDSVILPRPRHYADLKWFSDRNQNLLSPIGRQKQNRFVVLSVPLLSTRTESLNEGILERIAQHIAKRFFSGKIDHEIRARLQLDRRKTQILTLLRVAIPSLLTGIVATLSFPCLTLFLASWITDPGTFTVLSQESSQFVQNFSAVSSLLFSILVGQTYNFLYTQQESVYYALFEEVTEAKSLLEQVALVCQGRSMYRRCLEAISLYVKNDLRQLKSDPSILLSTRPVDDPLEGIMYMTSVGVPSTVYETVKSLRGARARRLGALQKKIPSIHMSLLWILAMIELTSFPLLGASTQGVRRYKLLTIEGLLFGLITGGIVLTMRVVGELWRPAGGAYNVDSVLSVMVSGLEDELKTRMSGKTIQGQSSINAPSAASSDRMVSRLIET